MVPVFVLGMAALLMLNAGASETTKLPHGYVGKTVLDKGAKKDTWWLDLGDDVEPGVPGCHVQVKGPKDKTPTGIYVGEACQSNVILVETTPHKGGEAHVHKGDIGTPLLIDCNVWCQKEKGSKGGMCKTVTPGPDKCASSAICSCN
jgi:hypothetical protein